MRIFPDLTRIIQQDRKILRKPTARKSTLQEFKLINMNRFGQDFIIETRRISEGREASHFPVASLPSATAMSPAGFRRFTSYMARANTGGPLLVSGIVVTDPVPLPHAAPEGRTSQTLALHTREKSSNARYLHCCSDISFFI